MGRGLLVTSLVLAAIELAERTPLRVPSPDPLYLVIVAYAAFAGGVASGLASATMTLAYAIYFYADAGSGRGYSHENLLRLGVIAVATPALALMVGVLRGRLVHQLARIKESEARTRAVVEGVADGIITFDDTGVVHSFAPGAERMFGFRASEVLGRHVGMLIPDLSQSRGRGGSEEAARGLLRMATARRAGGGEFSVEVTVSAVRIEGEGLTIAIVRDVTERRRAEKALQQQRDRLREQAELLDLAHDTIMVRDMTSAIVFWNHGAQEMYGFTPAEAVGRSSHELLKTQFPEPLPDIEAELLARGRWEGELIHVAKDGTHVVAASRWALQRDGSGEPSHVLEINNDITQRKRAEQALERLSRQNELILNSAGEGIFGLDLGGVATFVNPHAARMLGYEVGELVGRSEHDLFHRLHGDGSSYPQAECPVSATLLDGQVRRVADDVYVRRDGGLMPVEYVCTPLRENGSIVGAVVSFRDVTERREMERVKDELVSVVSHELRTPLASIRGALGLLAGGALGAVSATAKRMLDVAVASTDRLTRLVTDILDLERMESGKLVMAEERCDAADLVAQALETMGPAAEKEGVLLDADVPTLPLWADPDRVVQTLTNLLSNAIKFSPRGSRVRISAAAADGMVRFEVRDEGRGIPPDKIERVFERFEQVDASDSRLKGGTGLGLAICRRIVAQHGGRIWVDSVLGGGSVFRFTVPSSLSAPVIAAGEKPEQVELSERRILVIDDDDVIREVAQISLETAAGCEVLTAGSGRSGLELARRFRPDAILLDVMMPDEDGPAVLRRLHADPSTRSIPVVFLTAKARAVEHRRLKEMGAVGVITKPFDPLGLPRSLGKLLGWLSPAGAVPEALTQPSLAGHAGRRDGSGA